MNASKIIARKILSGALVGLIGFSAFAQDTEKLAAANNGFGFDLLRQIADAQPDKNIFISPFSASAALQMVANGAAGKTKTQMEHVLKTAGWSPDELNKSYKDLDRSLGTPRDATLEIANSVWYRNDLTIKPDFVADNKNYFQAGLASVDFYDPKTADVINDWASQHTHGKIQGVVSFPFPKDTALVLADAIYFKGKWETPFDKNATQPCDFYLLGGSSKKTPMMQRDGKFSYQETADFQAVQLPYNGHLRMEAFLPKTNSSPQKLVEMFREKDTWQKTIESGFREHDGFVALPKFKMDYEVEINQFLQNLGMRLAFDPNAADFSVMVDDPGIAIKWVKQKSYVQADEEGTEAAAVTTVLMTDKAELTLPPKNRFEMIVDRPFLFVIVDDATQTILFVGIVNNPAE